MVAQETENDEPTHDSDSESSGGLQGLVASSDDEGVFLPPHGSEKEEEPEPDERKANPAASMYHQINKMIESGVVQRPDVLQAIDENDSETGKTLKKVIAGVIKLRMAELCWHGKEGPADIGGPDPADDDM